MHLKPITIREARAFVTVNHRTHPAPQGGRFAIGAVDEEEDLIGVVIVGRPEARALEDGYTMSVTRLCCVKGNQNAGSYLLGAALRAAKAMGVRRFVSYTLGEEEGTVFRAAGWEPTTIVAGRSWNRPGRPRRDKHPLNDKVRWEPIIVPQPEETF